MIRLLWSSLMFRALLYLIGFLALTFAGGHLTIYCPALWPVQALACLAFLFAVKEYEEKRRFRGQ